MKLRDYQLEAVERCRVKFKSHKNLILCSPCGSGKTYVACELARLSMEKGKVICILVDRKEILGQMIKALAAFNLYPELIVAGTQRIRKTNLYLGMVESFHKRFHKSEHLRNIDFFIMDEAHSTAYFKIIKQAKPSTYFLGLTATPVLTQSKERLNDYYGDIVELAKVEDLIKREKLCDSVTYSIDLSEARKLKRANGDFTVNSQLEAMDNTEVYSGVIDNFQRLCPNSRFICYNINVEHSRKMSKLFQFNGIKCRHVDGDTEEGYRRETFAMLNSGEIQGVHNFGICTTGFDEPAVDCIIQNFSTDSLAKHIQTAGRGARIFDGKDKFYILDMGMNYTRHGLWNKDKDWSDIFHNPEQGQEKERKATEAVNNLNCITCGFVINSSMTECPICGAVIAAMLKEKTTRRKAEGATAAELKLIREQTKLNLPEYLKKPTKKMSKKEILEYAGIMGYSPKWAYMQLSFRGVYR